MLLDPADDLVVDVGEVVEGHPRLAQVLPQEFNVEGELQEHVHLDRLLGLNQLAEVSQLQLVQPKERKVGKDAVDGCVVAVDLGGVEGEEDLDEDLEEVLVTDASVEDLLDEYLLVGVFELPHTWVSRQAGGLLL